MIPKGHAESLSARRSLAARRNLYAALVLGLLLHIPLVQSFVGLIPNSDAGRFDSFDVTELSLLDGLDMSVEMTPEQRQEAEARVREREREEQTKEQEPLSGQVVSIPRPPDPRAPEKKTDFLAETDSRTEQETHKRGEPGDGEQAQKPAVGAALASREQSRDSEQIVPPSLEPASDTRESAEVETQPVDEPVEPDPADPLQLEDEGLLELVEDIRALGLPQQAPPSSRSQRYEALLPPRFEASGGAGNGGTDDYLPHIDEGEHTVLNARRFKYWSFFQRVKQSIKRNWNPVGELRRADPSGKVYGVRDRMTVLSVVLDEEGTLEGIQVIEQSGVAPLDDEALRAFRAAQPFPNPPSGLLDDGRRVKFQFSLYLDVHRGWQFRPTWSTGRGLR